MEFEIGLVPNSDKQSVPTISITVQQYSIVRDRERRTIEFRKEPSIYENAVSCSDPSKWMIAMQEEMKSIHKNGIWDMVRLPK